MSAVFRQHVARFLGRAWQPSDGISPSALDDAEARLGRRLPISLRNLYLAIGSCDSLCSVHNELASPDEIEVVDGSYLVFMHENQAVVSWGFRLDESDAPDPIVWQRNNAPPEEWYSEEKPLGEFIQSMFAWYEERGLFRHAQAPR